MDLMTQGVAAGAGLLIIYMYIESIGGWPYVKEKLMNRKPAMKNTYSFIEAPKKYAISYKKGDGKVQRYHGKREITKDKFMAVNQKGENDLELSENKLIFTPGSVAQILEGQITHLTFEVENDSTIVRYRSQLKAMQDHVDNVIREKETLQDIVSNVRLRESQLRKKMMDEAGFQRPKYDRSLTRKQNEERIDREQDQEEKMENSI